MELVPDQFEVPRELRTPDFFIRKLRFNDVDLDYNAVMSSIDIIKMTRGGSWPNPDLTHEEDHADLGWHDREFENRTSFAYTVMSPDEKECLGCFYLYPGGTRGEESKDADVDVSFWVTQKAYDQDLYEKLYVAITEFLKSWPFKDIVFTNSLIPDSPSNV
jgi:hypothetical protein